MLAALASATTAHAAVDVGQSGWSWGSPRLQGNDLAAVEFAAGGRGYAAGAFGTILRTEDAGATWAGVPTGRQTDFSELAVLGPDAFVAGGGCTLRRSDDGGRTLKRLPFAASETSCPAPLAALSFATPQAGTLVLADGTVLRTDDGGQTFSRRTALPGTRAAGASGSPRDTVFASPDAGLASVSPGPGGEILRTLDGGATWTSALVAPATVRSLHLAPGGTAYAVGDGPALYRSTDGGGSWEQRDLEGAPGGDAITGIRCRDADTCVMTTARGDRLLRTEDGGTTVAVIAAADLPLRALAFADASRVVAVGVRGATVVSSDAGASFARVGGELPGRYTRIRAAGGDLAFAVGLRGALARTTDGGMTWTPGAVSTSEDVIDAAFASASTGFALDSDGTLLRTDNAGASWRILATGEGGPARSVQSMSATTIVIAGGRGIRRSGNGGDTFDRVGPRNAAVEQLDRAGSALAAYGRRTLLVSSDGGRRWRTVKRPSKRTTIAAADFVSSRTGFLLDDNGRVFATANGGRRWRELIGIGASNVDGLAFSDPRNGWLVLDSFRGDRGGWVMRTDDGGRTFRPQLVSPTPLTSRTLGTATLAATGTRKAIAFSRGAESTDDDYDGGGTTVSGPQSFFATAKSGDAGREPRLSLAGPRKRPRRGARVRIAGRLVPARGGETVLVSLRSAGSTNWRSVSVRADSDGRFSLTRSAGRGLQAVAQWQGDETRASAGSRVLAVRTR
jgi:photosystem II stability/assembly factor-like uncharacterized protein